MDMVLFFLHYALLLLFGILLSLAFSGVKLFRRRGLFTAGGLFVFSGSLQILIFCGFNERLVWLLYPLITHVPLGLVLCLFYRKSIATALASIATAYLCCQPAKWMGLLCASLTGSYLWEQLVRIGTLLAVGFVALYFLSTYLAGIFNKDVRSVLIFGSVPMVNYLFDYVAGVYTNLWESHAQLAAEFMPFFLCVVFVAFCMVYYRQYEQKNDAQRRERIVSIQMQQQAARIAEVRRSEQELQLLRHDMRHFLGVLSGCLQAGNNEKARCLLDNYVSQIEATSPERFCENDMVNYVLTDFSARCRDAGIAFHCNVGLSELKYDEILFCSVLSNMLENALNAQLKNKNAGGIRLMLKTSDGKLLLSVKNPVDQAPVFVDGLPVSDKTGHGYGAQSIRYITERLGGNCMFCVQDGMFIVRVVL